MNRSDYVKLFNDANEGRPNQNLMSVISEYISEKNPKYAGQMITFLNQNLQLVNIIFPQIMKYYRTKYNIISVSQGNEILLYY